MYKLQICIYCLLTLLIIGITVPTVFARQEESVINEVELLEKASFIEINETQRKKTESTNLDNENSPKSVNVTFSLTILPVRFVYINENGDIERIWNNALNKHDLYGLKFYSTENEKDEINPTYKQLSAYYTIIQNTNEFFEGDIYKINETKLQEKNNSFTVDFVKNEKGNITEVHTLI